MLADFVKNPTDAKAGDSPDSYTVPEEILHWLLCVLYIVVSLSFVFYGYIIFTRFKKGKYPTPPRRTAIVGAVTMFCMVFVVDLMNV